VYGTVDMGRRPRETSPAETLATAMIDVAAPHGYAGASVARVLECSGLSRQSFYRQYADREDCFLAAYRHAAAEIGGHLREAIRNSTPAERPRATIGALLFALREHPAAARMVLLHALGGPASVRDEHERQLNGVERSIERFLGSPGAPGLLIPPVALLGGVCGVLSAHLLSEAPGGEEDLLDGLLAWVRSYEWPGVRPRVWPVEERWLPSRPLAHRSRPRPAVPLLPRGRSALSPEQAGGVRRSRILQATLRQTAAVGYRGLTVAGIVSEARVPRASFYAHFSGKREAFLSAQRVALRESIAAAAAEYATGTNWADRVWRALGALLDYIANHPEAAYLGFVEVHSAGRSAVDQHEEILGAYTLFLADGYRQFAQASELPALCSQAVAGGIEVIVRRYVAAGRADRVREALPACAYVALAPFAGPEAAFSWVEERDPE
jgi:AcrR family transcriptional regulator